MNPPNTWQRVREWLAGIAFDAFLWLSNMTNDEYLEMVYEDAKREIQSARANDWMMK